MRCLCCNKIIDNENYQSGWHNSCIKKFFGVSKMPIIELSSSNVELNKYGEKLIDDKHSVTGVQKKLSLHLSKEKQINRLTLIGYPIGYILKPESEEYPMIAKAEHMVMSMANECGIKTPLHALIKLEDHTFAYITKRIDRDNKKKIHMEDFCQLSKRLTEYKYNSSYEKCAKVIEQYSTFANLDKSELFYRLLFCFVTCNSDMNLKNFSLIEKENEVFLSPAYDLLPVNILINDEEEVALTLNGKKKKLTQNDFIKYGINIGLEQKIIDNLIKQIINNKKVILKCIDESLLESDDKEKYKELVIERFSRFHKYNIDN